MDPTYIAHKLPLINLGWSAIPTIKPLSCPSQFILWQQKAGRYKTLTRDPGLDCGLDCGLDYGLDYGLDFGVNWTLDSVLALLFKADFEC